MDGHDTSDQIEDELVRVTEAVIAAVMIIILPRHPEVLRVFSSQFLRLPREHANR